MISLSTYTTVPSMVSQHIAVSFLRTCKGFHHAPRIFTTDQNVLYSFFLILEFFLWTSCPWPNHWFLTRYTTQETKTKDIFLSVTIQFRSFRSFRSFLSPSFPWPEWLTSTPVVTLMTPLSQLKLQGLVYDILPLEEGAGKRWSECGYNYHSAFRSLAQHSSVAKHGWTKLFLARNVSSKFRKGREISWT